MAKTTNVNRLPPSRVPLIDSRTGLIATPWYRFFLTFFDDVEGQGDNIESGLLQPPPVSADDVAAAISQALSASDFGGADPQTAAVLATIRSSLDAIAMRPYGATLEDLLALRASLTKAIADAIASMPAPAETFVLPAEQDSRFGRQLSTSTPRINQMPIGRNNQGDLTFVTAGAFGQLMLVTADVLAARTLMRTFLFRATRSAVLAVPADTDTELTWASSGPAANGYSAGDMSLLNGRLWSTNEGVMSYDIKSMRIVTSGAADFVVTFFAASNGGAEAADNGKLPVKVRAIIPSAGRWQINTPFLVELANVTSASTLGIRFRTPPGAAAINITSAMVDVEQRN